MRYLYLFLAGALLVSCSSEPENQNNLTLPDGTLPTLNSSSATAPAGLATNPAHGQPGHDCSIPVGAPLKPVAVAESNTSEVKLNPEHGLPGHDCSIPVGAPLNAAKVNTSAPAPTPAPVPTPAPATSTEIVQEANGG